MEISKYDKSIGHLSIKDSNFATTVGLISHIAKLEDPIVLVELSDKVGEAYDKLSKINKEYYIDKNLRLEAVVIIDNVKRVEKIITRFLEDDIPYSKFALDLKEMTDIALKNVNASLQTINKVLKIVVE